MIETCVCFVSKKTQLKRFEYDYKRDAMVKINDRYEFPLELDLDSGDGKYLSADADRSVRNLYLLHSARAPLALPLPFRSCLQPHSLFSAPHALLSLALTRALSLSLWKARV